MSMNKILSFSLLFFLFGSLLLFYSRHPAPKKEGILKFTKAIHGEKGFVVIELFTSQGCSSCPPADRLLGRFKDRENVFALSFHVDYWNRLGWADPFSKSEYSRRQEKYVEKLGSSGPYTPQVFINGQSEMVGSDEEKIEAAIKQFQFIQSPDEVIIDEIKLENGRASITFSVPDKERNSVANVALVQNKSVTFIRAGENEGAMLTNHNVVKEFKTISTRNKDKNTVAVDLLPGLQPKDCSIIVYLQDIQTGKIYAAAKSAL